MVWAGLVRSGSSIRKCPHIALVVRVSPESATVVVFESATAWPGQLAMSEFAKGCCHLSEFRHAHGLQSYRIIYKYLVKPGTEARKLKVVGCMG